LSFFFRELTLITLDPIPASQAKTMVLTSEAEIEFGIFNLATTMDDPD
jgi:hypothetical protein